MRSCLREKSTKKQKTVQPLSGKQINPWRARETKDEARLKRRELSHTIFIVVQLRPEVTLCAHSKEETRLKEQIHIG